MPSPPEARDMGKNKDRLAFGQPLREGVGVRRGHHFVQQDRLAWLLPHVRAAAPFYPLLMVCGVRDRESGKQ